MSQQKFSISVAPPKKIFRRRVVILLAGLITACLLVGSITHADTSEEAPKIPAISVETAEQGAKLLEKQCLDCHLEEKLRRYRKNRDQWDRTIINMIRGAGVKLTEEEKSILLDYLTLISAPKKVQ